MAFIETPAFTGSGVLIEGGYVVTNAHVVWPFDAARVVFPDGSEFLEVPLLNWDLLGDLAVLGPIQTPIDPIQLVDGESLVTASEVFLIGYPGEVERFPQPTITRGIISRLRQWEAIEITYFQTDAAIAGGQSGGVLVSEDGEVIGVSGFTFTEAGFGIVASSADILPRIQQLIEGDDVSGLGDRRVPEVGGNATYSTTVPHAWAIPIYVINEPAGTVVEVEIESPGNALFAIVDVYGQVLITADDSTSGREAGSVTTEYDAPYFLIIAQHASNPIEVQVSSNRNLVRYDDVDDGAEITVGKTIAGNIDYPSDFDYFVIDLAERDVVEITVDSAIVDTLVGVAFPFAQGEQTVGDDDSGGGLLGGNPKLTYRAPHTGTFWIIVNAPGWAGVGGYFLTVSLAPPRADAVYPPLPTTPTPTRVPVQPTPTQAPVAGSDEIATVLAEIETTVLALRETSLPDGINRESKTREELASIDRDFYAREEIRQELFEKGKLYQALGLLNEEEDLVRLVTAIELEYAKDAYATVDYESGNLYVVGDPSRFGPAEILQYVGAYLGAILDSLFDLSELERAALQADFDHLRALSALVVGDVFQVYQKYAEAFFSQEQLDELSNATPNDKLLSAPPIVQKLREFPVTEGAAFVAELLDNEGWEGVNEAYGRPPISTEQVIHPDKYFAQEGPQRTTIPDISDQLGEGWTQVSSNTMGEFLIRTYLEGYLDGSQAGAAASGWGGDRYSLLSGPGGERLLISVIKWDSLQDSEEFFQAYQVFAANKMRASGGVFAMIGETGRKWVATDEAIFLGQVGPTILLIIADDEETIGLALQLTGQLLQAENP